MTKTIKPRDTDRALLYSAEQTFRAMLDHQHEISTVLLAGSQVYVPQERRFADLVNMQRYVARVYDVANIYGLVPTVRSRRGNAKAHYEVDEHTIAVPTDKHWAMREVVLLHEIAHASAPTQTHGTDWHNKTFRREFARLVGLMMGPEGQFILSVLMMEMGLAP